MLRIRVFFSSFTRGLVYTSSLVTSWAFSTFMTRNPHLWLDPDSSRTATHNWHETTPTKNQVSDQTSWCWQVKWQCQKGAHEDICSCRPESKNCQFNSPWECSFWEGKVGRHSFSVKKCVCWFRSCYVLISSKLKTTTTNLISCVTATFSTGSIAEFLFHEKKPLSCIRSSPDPLLR